MTSISFNPNNYTPSNINGVTGQTTEQVTNPTSTDNITQPLTVTNEGTTQPTNGGDVDVVELEEPNTNTGDSLEVSLSALSSSTSVFVSVLALIQLLRDCADEQKETSRLARQAEYNAAKSSIAAQAAEMRSVGILSLAAGITGAVISAGMSVGSSVSTCKALTAKLNMTTEVGIPKLSVNASKSFANLDAADANLTQVKQEIVGQQNETLTQNHTAQVTAAEAKVAELRAAQPQDPQAIADAEAQLTQLRDNPPKSLVEVDEATLTPEQSARLSEATTARDLAEVKYNHDTAELKMAKTKLEADPKYIELERTLAKSEAVQTASQSLSQLFNTAVTGGSTIMNAMATAEQAVQKSAEERADDQGDLVQDATNLQHQVLDTLNQIYQVESQSFKQILA